jgi:hypothetical protein
MTTRPETVTLVDALAEGLWARCRDALLVAERLQGFAWTPERGAGQGGGEAPAGRSEATDQLARDLVLRALGAAVDPVNARILGALRGGQAVPVSRLAETLGLPPLALTERVGALAQVGLATRDLEHDAIVPTGAGRAALALVEALVEALGERFRRGLPGLPTG